MANDYSYDREDANKKKKEEYQFGLGTLGAIATSLIPGYGMFLAPDAWKKGIAADTKTEYQMDPEARLEAERQNRRKAALSGLPEKGPTMAPEMESRIAAWQNESKAPTDTSYFDKQIHEGPLATDPRFQRDQALLASGAASQAANIANLQRATGTRGGFQNVGSIADVYDRMGSQLAELGQGQQALNQGIRQQRFAYGESERARKSALADRSAQARQSFVEAQIAHENAVKQARAAIESGDVDLGMKLIMRADEIKRNEEERQRQFVGNIIGGVVQGGGAAAGAAMGGPAGAKLGAEAGARAGDSIRRATAPGPQASDYGIGNGYTATSGRVAFNENAGNQGRASEMSALERRRRLMGIRS